VTVRICDRCGDVTINTESCTCATPYDPAEPGRRHRAAVEAARTASNHKDHTASTPPRPRARAVSTHHRRSTP
jgi:hypothetical protein